MDLLDHHGNEAKVLELHLCVSSLEACAAVQKVANDLPLCPGLLFVLEPIYPENESQNQSLPAPFSQGYIVMVSVLLVALFCRFLLPELKKRKKENRKKKRLPPLAPA